MKRAMLALTAVLALRLLTAAIGYADSPDLFPGYHIVKPGETLYSIGWLYGVSPWAIARANYLPNPNLIYPGQVLRIPCWWGWWKPYKPPYRYPCYYPYCIYIVQPSDTLTKIACKYGTTVWAIAQANCIPNVNLIYIGQRLIIPSPYCN